MQQTLRGVIPSCNLHAALHCRLLLCSDGTITHPSSRILHNASWYMKAAYICVLVRQEHILLLLLLQLELLCSYPQGFP